MAMRPSSGSPVPGKGLGAHILLLPAAATMLLQSADGKMHESHMLVTVHP